MHSALEQTFNLQQVSILSRTASNISDLRDSSIRDDLLTARKSRIDSVGRRQNHSSPLLYGTGGIDTISSREKQGTPSRFVIVAKSVKCSTNTTTRSTVKPTLSRGILSLETRQVLIYSSE